MWYVQMGIFTRATGQGASCKQDGLTLKEESRAIIEPLMNAITKV